jgi:aconitate hydratase A / 2-methylisocitrate dehydratase
MRCPSNIRGPQPRSTRTRERDDIFDGDHEYGGPVDYDSLPLTLRRVGSWSKAMTSQANDVLVPLTVGNRTVLIAPVDSVRTGVDIGRLPYTLRILLENVVRAAALGIGGAHEIGAISAWEPSAEPRNEISFRPSRVLLQDFTGVPAIVDLAAMREAMHALGEDPVRVNPLLPSELVIDHSIQVDAFGTPSAILRNAEMEFQRNKERYAFLRWGQRAFQNFQVIPPNTGIVHQVNLEYLARVVEVREVGERVLAFPDTLVGTDSHTTMVNGLGVLGWGVGGIEAEAAMLGEGVSMLVPQVVGVKLSGRLAEGATATDLVLTVTQLLRSVGVVGKFVEYFGDGLTGLTIADRATIANMAPEYGATCGFFPVDDETLRYLQLTGRREDQVRLVEAYCKAQALFHDVDAQPAYTQIVELDLSSVEPSLAGPRRPQDRLPLSGVKHSFLTSLGTFGGGYGKQDGELAASFPASDPPKSAAPGARTPVKDSEPTASTSPPVDASASRVSVRLDGQNVELSHGSVVIAAITSCTNTSNPSVMIAAGLLAKKAVERGLQRKPWVKTSLAPGSKVVTDYYRRTGLTPYLEALGFATVGYGCTTCIGNSGPLAEPISQAIADGSLVACSVLSGNRNFEARIHPEVKANYLASPPLVVAYAIAGRIDIDLTTEPLAEDRSGRAVFLRDLWPSAAEVVELVRRGVDGAGFRNTYADVFAGDERWAELPAPEGGLFAWDLKSTYVRRPPYFDGMAPEAGPIGDITGARCLVMLGDSVTTDHISPAGAIHPESPAGQYLLAHGIGRRDFNSYGSRRGNHEVMVRGTFANVRLRNFLVPGREGPWTVHLPTGDAMSIFAASERYRTSGTPLVVLAGKEYGAGSSRDWAAKGPQLLGVRAVIAESYERIHRSNLIGMGILPLQFRAGVSPASLGLTGRETFAITGLAGGEAREATVTAVPDGGGAIRFDVRVRIETPREREYLRHGGILPYALRKLLRRT